MEVKTDDEIHTVIEATAAADGINAVEIPASVEFPVVVQPPKGIFLIVGATSSLAQTLCHVLAKNGYSLILAGRDIAELELLEGDIATRYNITSKIMVHDFFESDFSPSYFIKAAGDFDHIVITIGDMGDSDQTNIANLAYTMLINYTLPAQIATEAAIKLAEKITADVKPKLRRGAVDNAADTKHIHATVVLISSVAGDRGRQSNYAYGSAKAAFSTFASGLRNRFFKSGVHVMTVKPGFMDTPMTWGMKSKLIASREKVAGQIMAAIKEQKNIIYVPGFWRLIMFIIIYIPESVFKRLKL